MHAYAEATGGGQVQVGHWVRLLISLSELSRLSGNWALAFTWTRGYSAKRMSTVRLPPKKDVAIALLEKSSIFVHLDPRHERVRVPPWLRQRVPLVLQVGLNMAVPIPDLDVGEDALSCTLSFQRRPHFCFIPWDAVYALVGEDQRGMVWPDDVPKEVAAQAQKQKQIQSRRSSLRAVPATPDESSDGEKGVTEQEESARTENAGEPVAERSPEPEQKRRLSVAPPPEPEASSSEPSEPEGPTADDREDSASKKGRNLPPYLRVVK